LKRGKIVLVTGVFDILHVEHLMLLEEAKALAGEGGKLVVVVARDATVERREGKRPVVSENERRAMVEALKPVDEAVLGYEDMSVDKVLVKVKPDLVVFGYDQGCLEELTRRVAGEMGLSVETVRMAKFSLSELDSGTKIKQKIVETWKPTG